MSDRDDRRDPDPRVYDATSPLVRVVEAMVDLVVLLVYGVFRALVEGVRAAFAGSRDDPNPPSPLEHPEPDDDGAYRTRRQSDRGKSGPRGGSAANT